jgi:hypothetical protein
MGRTHDVVQLLSPRPHTAQPLAFDNSLHLSPLHFHTAAETALRDLQPRPSFQGPLPSELCAFGPIVPTTKIQTKDSRRWKHDNRLKRTIETMTTGVEKFMGKMGLSRPLRVTSDHSSSQSATCGTKRSSVHATTESNSISRSYRTRSKRTKRTHSVVSQFPSSSSNSSLTPQDDLDSSTTKHRSGAETTAAQIVYRNPISPHTLAFPATAGAGAKAAVAQHKKSFANLRLLSTLQHDKQYLDMDIDKSDCEGSQDLEFVSTQSWADSMDLDSVEYPTLQGACFLDSTCNILTNRRSCYSSSD